MKILFVAPSNSVHLTRWIHRATNSGIQADLYDLVPGASKPGGLEIQNHFSPKPGPSFLLKFPIIGQLLQVRQEYLNLRDAISMSKPDVIHCHWLFHGAPFAATYLAGDIPLIATPWGSDIQFSRKLVMGKLKKVLVNQYFISRIARKSDYFCCDSNKIAELLIRFGAKKSKINIIYFGTDISTYSKSNRSNALRIKFGATNEDDLLVISNRSHEPIYDLPTLFYAARDLKDNFAQLKYVIAGSGSLTEDLKLLAVELGISDIVHFTGRLDDNDFVSATASCDIYVSTSTSDGGLAASTAEAMACEIPAIVTNFGENSIWVDGTSTGRLFEIGDIEGLKAALIELSLSAELRNFLGTNGRLKIVSDNNSEVEWKKVMNMYESAIGSKSS